MASLEADGRAEPAHWWVELGFGPLVRRAVGGGVSGGIRKFLGTCLMMTGAVSPSSQLSDLRCPSTSSHTLLGAARSWCS